MNTENAEENAEHQAGPLRPSTAEINAVLLDLYRIGCVFPTPGKSAVSDPSVMIGSPLLERVLTAVHADGGALVLAHLSEATPTWSPPGRFVLSSHDRILALSHTLPNQLPGLADATDGWLCFTPTLPATGARPAYELDAQPTDATHAVVLLKWLDPVRQTQGEEQARALLPALAEAILAAIGMILLHDAHTTLQRSAHAHETYVRETDATQADWQQAFDAISDPVSIVDADYHLLRANVAYRALFGDEAISTGHHRCFSHHAGQAAPCEGCPLPHTLATGQPGFVQRERLMPGGADGQLERRVYQTWTYPARNRVGVVDHAVEIVKDVTDQERLREVISRAEVLSQADRLKAELLGTVSHELRSPLATIRGYAETLQRYGRRIARDERQAFLTAIIQASDRLQVVINRVLELSELATGTLPVQRIPVDVLPIIQEAVAACARPTTQTTSRRLEFTVVADDGANEQTRFLPPILADPRLLRDVLDNLLENAVRYSPEGGQITISVRPQQACNQKVAHPGFEGPNESADTPLLTQPTLEITVQDTGIGIPLEHLGRIFDRFHRVDTRLTRDVDGLGIGLAICKQIVELHGGAIWAESEPGVGSAFHVLLPRATDDMTRDHVTNEKQTEGH